MPFASTALVGRIYAMVHSTCGILNANKPCFQCSLARRGRRRRISKTKNMKSSYNNHTAFNVTSSASVTASDQSCSDAAEPEASVAAKVDRYRGHAAFSAGCRWCTLLLFSKQDVEVEEVLSCCCCSADGPPTPGTDCVA